MPCSPISEYMDVIQFAADTQSAPLISSTRSPPLMCCPKSAPCSVPSKKLFCVGGLASDQDLSLCSWCALLISSGVSDNLGRASCVSMSMSYSVWYSIRWACGKIGIRTPRWLDYFCVALSGDTPTEGYSPHSAPFGRVERQHRSAQLHRVVFARYVCALPSRV